MFITKFASISWPSNRGGCRTLDRGHIEKSLFRLFCIESHVFVNAAKSLKASEGKLSSIAADTFLRIFVAIPGTLRYY